MRIQGRLKLKILAIDTSGEQAGAAIIVKNDSSPYITAGEIFLNARMGEKSYTHSEILMPGVEQLFAITRFKPADIDFVAYTNGPGSFTGLRIGASSAIAIARALNKPAIPVPTLDALAYNIFNEESIIAPIMDARRNQVYSCFYSRRGKINQRLTEYMALDIDECVKYAHSFNKNVIFLGDGTAVYGERILKSAGNFSLAPANNNIQRASSVGLAAEALAEYATDYASLELFYLRKPQAEREYEEKHHV
jgi:tRNA threonylcarbamoyladenosine biosynthesis protein TsaB